MANKANIKKIEVYLSKQQPTVCLHTFKLHRKATIIIKITLVSSEKRIQNALI